MFAFAFDESLFAFAYETPPFAFALLYDRNTHQCNVKIHLDLYLFKNILLIVAYCKKCAVMGVISV